MTTNLPAPLSITLVMDPEKFSALQRDTGALESARAYVIDSPDMAKLTNDELRSTKARRDVVKEWKAKFVEPAKQIIANAEALFDPALDALGGAEAYYKGLLADWTVAQQRLADEKRREQEAVERKARQEAEAKAAAARAKAEEEAAEQQRKARQAEEEAAQARAAGNAKEAARKAAEAAKASEAAAAAIENGNVKANEAVMTVAAAAAPVVEPAKVSGFSMRDHWIAELLPNHSEAEVLELIVAAIAGVKTLDGRRDLLALLALDMPAASKLAKAQKALMSVPGMRAMNRPISASTRAA